MMIVNGIGVRLDLVWNKIIRKTIHLLIGQIQTITLNLDLSGKLKISFLDLYLSIKHKLMIWHNKETQTLSSTNHTLRNKK